MRRRTTLIFGIVLLTILFPYVVTLAVNGKIPITENELDISGKYITVEDGKDKERMDVERYIIGVLAAQIPPDWEEETLKAQAVVLRTYIVKKMTDEKELNSKDLDLPYYTYSKLESTWGDNFTEYYSKFEKAASKTGLEVIKFNGNLVTPYFHMASAGKTRNGVEVLGSDEYAYLPSVESSKDIEAEDYLTMKTYTKEEFVAALKKYNSEIEIDADAALESVQIASKCQAGYVMEIQVGNLTMTGDEFVECFSLNSPNFVIEDYEGNIRIITKGIGHGLGLSLYGANEMAKDGKSYEEILSYYYQNISIENE